MNVKQLKHLVVGNQLPSQLGENRFGAADRHAAAAFPRGVGDDATVDDHGVAIGRAV
jgi:hypothetical protein